MLQYTKLVREWFDEHESEVENLPGLQSHQILIFLNHYGVFLRRESRIVFQHTDCRLIYCIKKTKQKKNIQYKVIATKVHTPPVRLFT